MTEPQVIQCMKPCVKTVTLTYNFPEKLQHPLYRSIQQVLAGVEQGFSQQAMRNVCKDLERKTQLYFRTESTTPKETP